MNKIKAILFIFITTLMTICSCMKDDMRPITEFNTGDGGVFIVCEGNFMYGNTSLSYYNKTDKSIENTVFLKANGIPLGDVAQSLCIYDSTAWIVVNNSGKIYAIDKNSFKYKGKITGLTSPRYMQFINPNKAYVTDMYSKSISVINPNTYTVTKTIAMNSNSEEIVFCDDKMFVNSWSYDNKILIINTLTDEISDSIEVLYQPRKIVLDKDKKLWVLCDGGHDGSEFQSDAGIIKINTETLQIEQTYIFEAGTKAIDLKINKTGDTIYYICNNVYRMSINQTTLPVEEYIKSEGQNFYALGCDPENSDSYVSDAVDYMQSGVIYRYNSAAQCVDSFRVGIIPNSFVFK
ncbi:MAG: YncE family protein [Bacteroidales bacterium]|nr:YncE family protein [Bacteroidales bacterium]